MRLLLDENVTKHLAPLLAEHDVVTVQRMGWSGLSNGLLLGAMTEAGITVLITMDRNLQFQLPLANFGVKLIVLLAKSNGIRSITPLVPVLLEYLGSSDRDTVRLIRV